MGRGELPGKPQVKSDSIIPHHLFPPEILFLSHHPFSPVHLSTSSLGTQAPAFELILSLLVFLWP